MVGKVFPVIFLFPCSFIGQITRHPYTMMRLPFLMTISLPWIRDAYGRGEGGQRSRTTDVPQQILLPLMITILYSINASIPKYINISILFDLHFGAFLFQVSDPFSSFLGIFTLLDGLSLIQHLLAKNFPSFPLGRERAC